MTTVTLQIGNTDNKLTQQEWAGFVHEVKSILSVHDAEIHFFGGSETYASWQNVAWVFVVQNRMAVCEGVKRIREKYRQDSAAWTEGTTAFI